MAGSSPSKINAATGQPINRWYNQITKKKGTIVGLFFILISAQGSFAQNATTKQEMKDLSKAKWQWMADKNVNKLALLFHDKATFVPLSGTWKKNEALDIIKTGRIGYKKAHVHDVAVELVDDMAFLWNRITLTAVVRGSDALNEFTVTEVYKNKLAIGNC